MGSLPLGQGSHLQLRLGTLAELSGHAGWNHEGRCLLKHIQPRGWGDHRASRGQQGLVLLWSHEDGIASVQTHYPLVESEKVEMTCFTPLFQSVSAM